MGVGRRLRTRVVSAVVAVVIGAGLVVPSPATAVVTATTWDLGDDFRFSPNQLNPSPDTHGNNDVWHYMEASGTAHNPATYSLLPSFTTSFGGGTSQGWHATDQYPNVLADPNRNAGVNPGDLENAVVGWKSPVTGTVYVSGRIVDSGASGPGNGVLWSVDEGSTTIASGSVAPGGEQLFAAGTGGSDLNGIPVTVGDFLYFILDPKVEPGCSPFCGTFDGANIEVTISDQPIPGPHRWRANGNARDYIGTNHGTLVNGATASGTPGAEGSNAFSLDGVNDYVQMPSVPTHYFSGSFTIEAWIKTTDTDGTILAKYECGGASCGVPPDHSTSLYELYLSGGMPALRLQEGAPAGGAIQGINGPTVVNNNAFHRIVAVRDVPADLLALYVDGVLVSLASLSSGADGPLNDNDTENDPLTIGAFIGDVSAPGVQSFLSGLIDDVRLSNGGAVDPADFDPTLDATVPSSPANDNSPEIKGTAIAGSTVNLYTDSNCTGPAVATGFASTFASPGLTPTDPLPDNSTTTFFATATVGTATSSCSTDSISYTEQTTVAAQFKPDGHIKRSKDATFLGDGSYNTTGANQTVLSKTKRGKKAVFNIVVQNDGTDPDAFTVSGCKKSRGFKVSYLDGATNITSQVTTSGFTTPTLAPGGTRALLLSIKVKSAGPKKKTCVVTATSQGNSSQDVVVGRVKAKG